MEESITALGPKRALGPLGEVGVLVGPFAKMGKCRISFPLGIAGGTGEEVRIFLT